MRNLSLSDLDPVGHTTFSFYAFFVSEGIIVAGAPKPEQASELAGVLLAQPVASVAPTHLDAFTALVLTHGAVLAHSSWVTVLAEHCAHGFCDLLGSEEFRSQRMRLTRLSMLLRELQDIDTDTHHVVESTILSKNPWDSLVFGADARDRWVISCDHDNVQLMQDQYIVWSRRLGLPTQLDALAEGVWVGSHYSDGGHFVLHRRPETTVLTVEHPQPLVLAFNYDLKCMALDAQGALWTFELDVSGAVARIGRKIGQLPTQLVHKARLIGSNVYAFDWTRPYCGVRLNLKDLQATVFDTGDVMVCNDVCQVGQALYAVCKLQGRIFKLDTQWKTATTRLGAGLGPGRLYDPIMIRSDGQGHLDVLNWFSGKLTRLAAF